MSTMNVVFLQKQQNENTEEKNRTGKANIYVVCANAWAASTSFAAPTRQKSVYRLYLVIELQCHGLCCVCVFVPWLNSVWVVVSNWRNWSHCHVWVGRVQLGRVYAMHGVECAPRMQCDNENQIFTVEWTNLCSMCGRILMNQSRPSDDFITNDPTHNIKSNQKLW